MKKFSKIILIIVAISIVLYLAVNWLPIPAQPWSDFLMLYSATRGMRDGINLYDHVGQVSMLEGVIPEGLEIPLYVYPPWYALSVFYLGWLPPEQAARLWMILNAFMLATSISLLTAGLQTRKRAWAFAAVFLFPPALGTLAVGQFVLPVLLGTAMFLYGVRRHSEWMVVLGLLLQTFKPHVGILTFLVGGLWLLMRSEKWARRSLWLSVSGGLILLGISFVFDTAWLSHYLGALQGFGNLDTFVICDLCAGVPSQLVRWITGQPYSNLAVWVSAIIAILGCLWLIWKRPSLGGELEWLIVSGAVAVLFVNPYLMNYDYIMLIPSVFYLYSHYQIRMKSAFIFLLFLPWLGITVGNRQVVSASLVFCASIIILLMSIMRNRRYGPI